MPVDNQQYMNFIPMGFQQQSPYPSMLPQMNNMPIPIPGMYPPNLQMMNPMQYPPFAHPPNFLPPNMMSAQNMPMPIIPPYIQQPNLVQNKPQIPINNK